ncbi:phosphonate C-P lyase system protein PhnH [Halotalea alkalilenta]|uniref:Phosphonate C-P lyase system protein PhnH n=1 Tax=Halotalea alkalilenta TaxID=376489 RepID=A0A172YDK8_9GAMM|nr:phosphonate C-P lyase system protein PhnH [Halotalea alkalilenta]ANF57360.1 hypothetical protein A5892_07695 [Halotalea alkalilenta]
MLWHPFSDPVHDAQRHFRQLLAAMAEPGLPQQTGPATPRPQGAIGAAAWATLLTLCDLDTPVWIDPRLEGDGLRESLSFHTGCALCDTPACAAFLLLAAESLEEAVLVERFSIGTDLEPEHSATLIVEVESLNGAESGKGDWRLSGPGIAGQRAISVGGGVALARLLAANRAHFPRGLDAILCAGGGFTAIPRSTRIESASLREVA